MPTTNPFPGDNAADHAEPIAHEQPNEIISDPPQELGAERTTDIAQGLDSQPILKAEVETMPDTSGETIQESITDLPSAALAEPVPESLPEPDVEVPPATAATVSGPSFEARDESAIKASPEIAAGVSPQLREKSAEEDIPEPRPESVPETFPGLMVQPTPLVTMEKVPVSNPEPVDEPVMAPFEELPPTEPAAPRVAEVYYEPPVEPVERRFSFTRPTASPKAPTPSPPTPIEDKVALRAGSGWVSPKAPTMSPPTPLDRSMPSSPDIPLAEQQFALPPPIDAAHMGDLAHVLNAQQIPNANRITVEAAPEVEPQINAQIPVEHDPLDGMAEPRVAHDIRGDPDADDQTVQFSDGEEDLLGSLERSLG